MRSRFILIALTLVAMFSSSCIKEKLEVTYNKQETQIRSEEHTSELQSPR